LLRAVRHFILIGVNLEIWKTCILAADAAKMYTHLKFQNKYKISVTIKSKFEH
jgi:hypothetical protein